MIPIGTKTYKNLTFEMDRQTLKIAIAAQIEAEKAYKESGLEGYIKTIQKMYGIKENDKTKS